MTPTAIRRALAAGLVWLSVATLAGQQTPAVAPSSPPSTPTPTARAMAPIDLTGYWVSVVTEDWRWRMVTPAKGDYASVPLNADGRKVADAWDLARDKASGNLCRAFGAAALLRLPLRVHITWQDDATLVLETDAGQQKRLFHFGAATASRAQPPANERGWQGVSVAEWFKQRQSTGLVLRAAPPAAPVGGNLKVVTTRLRAGYLRKNGVPYSENTVVTEYFNRHAEPAGEWFTVTSVVEDPTYLNEPFITSSSFRREPDASKWHPAPCSVDVPR